MRVAIPRHSPRRLTLPVPLCCLVLGLLSGCTPQQDTAAILPAEQVDTSAVGVLSVDRPELDSAYNVAAALCQRTSSSAAGSASAPRLGAHSLLLLKKGHDAATFSRTHGLPVFMQALTQSQVRYVVCVAENQFQVGIYVDPQGRSFAEKILTIKPAYQFSWSVSVVKWPDGPSVAQTSFKGPMPAPAIRHTPLVDIPVR